MATVRKTRNPKTNSFTSILDQFLNKYNLSAESTPLQLCAHADELNAMLPNWKAHKRKEKFTIKERAQRFAESGDLFDIYVDTLKLVKTKNDSDKEIVASSLRYSLYRKELENAGVDPKIISLAKNPEITRASNKIQKKQLERELISRPKTPKHFSLEEGLRRLQNIRITETPTLQNLADTIMMLSMRPAEVTTLRIIHYEPDESNPPEWYNPDYSWYCTGYIKNKGEAKNNPEPRPFLSMKKNPERARELLTWIQNAIAIGKLRDPVYSINGKRSTRVFSKFLKPYGITAKRLRKIGGKHASRVHSGQNPTSQHLALLSRIAMRHKIDRHDSGMYYAEGDTSDSDLDSDLKPEPEIRAFITKPIDKNTSTSEVEDIIDLYGKFSDDGN
ncbi:24165_t:CDS:2 [Dentiscutata erythropus]|uniref:24165_t:CDS:1 n=1 Tax=Dentiscutata erythropus TaxID=1348616 RepID=A0A9N9I859_9GLOM|nr:24165_t:CDS:2 [Dentiscutata erythropus]